MQRQPSDLIIVSIVTVICAATTLVMAASPVLRVIGGVPLVLILPGYAITAACLPRRSFGQAERLLISLGLSVAITILLGLVLYYAGISLQLRTWAIALASTTLVACGIAWRRRPAAEGESSPVSLSINLSLRNIVLLGLAVVVSGVAIGIARLPTPPNEVSGYTLLWMVPTSDENSGSYQLGVTSQEFAAMTYHLQVTVDGRVTWDWPELKLAPGDTWKSPIVLHNDQLGAGSIEATLYRLDNPKVVYRQVKLQPNG